MKYFKILTVLFFLVCSTLSLANPYLETNVTLLNENLIVEYSTVDEYYLKNIQIETKNGILNFEKNKNEIKIKNYNPNNKIYFSYEGCVSKAFCQERVYLSPMKINNKWTLIETEFVEKIVETKDNENFLNYVNDPNLILKKLSENSFLLNIFVFFLIGMLLSFTPCIFPMLPIVSSIVIKNDKKNPFILSSFYALGIAFSYALIGLVMGSLNLNLQIHFQNSYVIMSVSFLFFLLGFLMIGNYSFSFFNKSNNFLNNKTMNIKTNNYLSTFSIGFISSLVISPCAAAPIIGILIYMQTEQHSIFQQVSILFSLGLGAGVPLIIISSSMKKILPKNGNWMNHVKNVFGAILFGVGVYTLQKTTHYDLSALYIIITLTFLTSFVIFNNKSYYIGSLLILFLFLTYGESNEKIENLNGIDYLIINDMKTLNENILKSKKENKPVFIDIYADWCTTCIKMDKETLNDHEVSEFTNKNFLAIKIDITNMSPDKQNILKKYKLQTAPAYIFYNKEGNIEKNYYVGFLNKENFLKILNNQL